MSEWRSVRVPASSANLGPGFDAMGMALDVYLECRFRAAGEVRIRAEGRDAEKISTREDNLIWEIARGTGLRGGIDLLIANAIPIGKGLGSSAAAVVAGVVIGAELAELDWDRARILDEAVKLEGHPDNAAPCVLGGIVASAADSCGRVHAVRVQMPDAFGVAVIVPDYAVPTAEARAVLPETYSRKDAIFNVQRAALLAAALASGNCDAFPTALEDRMHQPYRFALVPGLEEITALRAPGLLGCALSGAGPSILAFYERGHEAVCERVREIFSKHGRDAEILWTRVPASGYELSTAPAPAT
ncbi:MAG TPA: homoserine kinase [Bryobacteraceae bacterium]|nr:homoserine kinase [Bryobacteraceae bacterium]